MNLDYLNSLPEEKNKFKSEIGEGEKVVFIAKGVIFGTDSGRAIGYDTKFTMTNKRFLVDNGKGVWTIDIANDIAGCQIVDRGKGLMKEHFAEIALKAPFVFMNGNEQITTDAYMLVFKKKDEPRFMEIMGKVLA